MIPLLEHAIDYAGLFPPAGLSMAEAKANYRRYRASEDAWALGRFVVPVSQVDAVLGEGWPLAVTLPHGFTGPVPGAVDTVEAPARTAAEIAGLVGAYPGQRVYCELDPAAEDLEALVAAVKSAGARAKLRCGGVRAEAIPSPEQVLRFLRAAAAHDVRFKATAGLHHAVRGRYPLTYAPDAPTAVMHGFANLAAALADPADLLCDDPHQLGRLLQAGAAGRRLFDGFGSCSFEEPLFACRTRTDYAADGVDLTLIRSCLDMTPAQRLEECSGMAGDIERMLEYGRGE